MINLAGSIHADKVIEEELYLAEIPLSIEKSSGEVHYNFIGKLEEWTFKRAWYYYIASCLEGLGLPYNMAVELHERKYPVSDSHYTTLGQVIRVDGDCTCPHPSTRTYSTLESIEKEFVEARWKFSGFDWNAKKAFDKSTLRELNGLKYIRLYHIDTQVGLRELANRIKGE